MQQLRSTRLALLIYTLCPEHVLLVCSLARHWTLLELRTLVCEKSSDEVDGVWRAFLILENDRCASPHQLQLSAANSARFFLKQSQAAQIISQLP